MRVKFISENAISQITAIFIIFGTFGNEPVQSWLGRRVVGVVFTETSYRYYFKQV